MTKKGKIFIGALFLTVMIPIVFGLFFVFHMISSSNYDYLDTEYFALTNNISNQAILARDYNICLHSFENITYKETEMSTRDDKKYIISVSASTSQVNCLGDYYRETFDRNTCGVIATIDVKEGNGCFDFLAEVYSDDSICDELELSLGDGSIMQCKARASLNHKLCYEIPLDDYDSSKYSRRVGFCIGDVVYRTKEHSACLEIDSSDYGEQWRLQRNKCIWNAMYSTSGKIVKWYCEYMVDGDLFGIKQNCVNRVSSGSSISVPPRLDN